MNLNKPNILIPGPVGNLEIITESPTTPRPITAVICHPHPLFGGTMQNKVVVTLARIFKDLQIPSVRFNFRGVGASIGSYAEGKGETDDLLAVLQWVKQQRPQDEIWLAGFSFGSYVAARGTHVWPVKRLICIAPPVENFNFTELMPIPCPWWVVQGDQDEIVPSAKVITQLSAVENPPQIIPMIGATHFFHSRLTELRDLLVKALS